MFHSDPVQRSVRHRKAKQLIQRALLQMAKNDAHPPAVRNQQHMLARITCGQFPPGRQHARLERQQRFRVRRRKGNRIAPEIFQRAGIGGGDFRRTASVPCAKIYPLKTRIKRQRKAMPLRVILCERRATRQRRTQHRLVMRRVKQCLFHLPETMLAQRHIGAPQIDAARLRLAMAQQVDASAARRDLR